MFSAFKEENGLFSMRRIISFIYAIVGIISGILCIIKGEGEASWQSICAAFGAPSLVSIILLLFTTWDDLNKAIKSVKGIEQKEE